MRNFILLLLFIALSFNLLAQKIRITDENGNGIDNVIVVCDDFTTHTNAQGYLKYFPERGTTQFIFMHPTYHRKTLKWNELEERGFIVVLKERNQQLGEIVIRPSKRIQITNEVPQRVLVLEPQRIALAMSQTTADMLSETGEVFIQKSQMGGGSPMIRGFSANRIMLVVDGVRMNNAIYRSGNLQNVISLDANSLEQTEIIMGPGSVIYGSDALGGVVHFYTLKPKLSTAELKTPVRFMTRYASANMEKTGHIDFNLGNQHWATATSITYTDYDHLTMGNVGHPEYTKPEYVERIDNQDQVITNSKPNKQVYSAYNQLNLIQKIRYRPSDELDMEYAIHYSTTSNIPRYDRLIQYSKENLKYAEWYYGPQQWLMTSLKTEWNVHGKLLDRLNMILAYQDYTESRFDRRLNKNTRNGRTENVDIFSLNMDADKYFKGGQSLYYGMEGIYNHIGSVGQEKNIVSNETTIIPSRYPDNSHWWSIAAYAMYNHSATQATTLQVGARYNVTGMWGEFNPDDYAFPFSNFSNTDGALTFNAGITYNPNEQIGTNVNISTGFRAPNIDDAAKVFDSEPGYVLVPNPKLDPEYSSSFEAGVRWKPFKHLLIDGTIYYTRLYNAMVRREGTYNGQDSLIYDGSMSKVLMMTNASWANIGGMALHFQVWNSKPISLKGSANWQKGKDSDGYAVRHVAPVFGNLHALYSRSKWIIDAFVLFNGEISFDNLAPDERSKTEMYASDKNGNPFSPAWYTLNLKSHYKITNKISLSTGIENLLDIRYRTYSSGIAAPGRNIIISVTAKL